MSKRSIDNLRIKRRYLVWLKEAKRLSESSIDKAAAAINCFEAQTKGRSARRSTPNRRARSSATSSDRRTTARASRSRPQRSTERFVI